MSYENFVGWYEEALANGKAVDGSKTGAEAAASAPATGSADRPNNKTPLVFNGHTYLFVQNHLTWNDAEQSCEQLGGYLATVTSKEEMDFIAGIIPPSTENDHIVWIGGTDREVEGEWRWVTGEPFTYFNWKNQYEPNNAGDEDYLQIDENPGWNDAQASQLCFYVCEWGE
jgi:hypothetical protein